MKKPTIHVMGYHDMFSLRYGGLENLTLLEFGGKTLAIEAPSHITKNLPNAQNIDSDSKIKSRRTDHNAC